MSEVCPSSREPSPPPAGEDSAALIRLLYGELRAMAAGYFRSQPDGHSLQPTALVHEAFLKLRGGGYADRPLDRTHFLALAARTMRQVLVDHARAKQADKRGGGIPVSVLSSEGGTAPTASIDVLQLNEALKQLAELDPRAAAVVELRFFAGLTIEQAAQTLGVSDWTVEQDWRVARSWLARRLSVH